MVFVPLVRNTRQTPHLLTLACEPIDIEKASAAIWLVIEAHEGNVHSSWASLAAVKYQPIGHRRHRTAKPIGSAEDFAEDVLQHA